MSVKVRSPKTKRLIIIFSILTILTAGAGGFVIWQLTKDVGSDRSRAGEIDTCEWCAGADQCWQSTGHAPETLSTPACGGGACCTGFVPAADDATPTPEPSCGSSGACEAGSCCSNVEYPYTDARCTGVGGNEPFSKCTGTPSCSSDPNCGDTHWQTDICRGTLALGCYCKGCEVEGGCAATVAAHLDPNNPVPCNAPCECVDWMKANGYTAQQIATVENHCLVDSVWGSEAPLGNYENSQCLKAQYDVTSIKDGNYTYVCHKFEQGGKEWPECIETVEEKPLCVSMKLNGESRHSTALTVTTDTQSINLALQGKDPDGRPLKMGYCYSIAGQTNDFYLRGDAVWICNEQSNFVDKGGSVYESIWSNLTFASLRTALVNKNISGVTLAEINEKGLVFLSRIYDNSIAGKYCSTNPAYNNGGGIIIPGATETCNGDNCRALVQLAENPVCAGISPKDVEIREARSITFTGTASSPVTVFKWRADTDCDGNVNEHDWITNTLTTASLTNTQAFNFTPGSSEVCRVEVRVQDETTTRPVCTFDIPYVPAGEIIVDKTGPVCVERIAPNNVARFTVTVTIPTDSEQSTMNIVRITDILPLGFRYVTGSATLTIGSTAQTLGVPTSSISNDVETLVWSSTTGWNLARNQQMVLVFQATATGTARTGQNINEVVVEPKDGDPVHDEYPFAVEQTCAPVPATGVMDVLPYITTLCLLVLGIYLYREDFLLSIPKVHVNVGVKESGKLLRLKLTRPKEYYEEKALNELKKKNVKRKVD